MKHKTYVNQVFDIDSTQAPAFNTFSPVSLVPGNVSTVQEVQYDFKIKTNPTPNATDWHARVDLFPQGSGNGTWTTSRFPRYVSGDTAYWPVNQDDGPTIHYGNPAVDDPWREDIGIVSITHTPDNINYYLANSITIQVGMYAFGTPAGATMQVELVSITVTYNGYNLIWDQPRDRIYQTGIDRGVFCAPEFGVPAVVWNGLISVDIDREIKRELSFFDGVPIHNVYTFGSISGKINAISEPANFGQYGSLFKLRQGVYLHDQAPKRFNFSYRTKIGDSVDPDMGYKLHFVYNALAIPGGHNFETEADTAEPAEHSWDFTTAPSSISGRPPSSYLVLDSRHLDPDKLATMESLTYGLGETQPYIWPLSVIVDYLEP